MGRIRTVDVMSITEQLIDKYTLEHFSDNFSDNKDKLKAIPEILPSKKLVNRVAGNLTRLFKQKQAEMKKLLEGKPEEFHDDEELD